MLGRVRVIIQARMGSSRLPGKVMSPLGGRPLLWHVVTRLQAAATRCTAIRHQNWQVAVATTTAPLDDCIAAFCRDLAIGCFRGSADDVLGRYVAAAADLAESDTVLRATADNPLYCPQRTSGIVAEHLRHGNDYTCIENLSYVVPEVMQAAALRQMAATTSDPYAREHVTPFFRQGVHAFRVGQLPRDWRGLRSDLRLTVDTPEELERMQAIFVGGRSEPLLSIERAYELARQFDVGETRPCASADYAMERPHRSGMRAA